MADKATEKRGERAHRARSKIRDRRRFKVTYPPTGLHSRPVAPESPAATDGVPVFQSKVQEVDERDVLTDGAFNAKLGGDVLVGDLRGAKIKKLALPERTTCPRSCVHWLTCYGNSDPAAVRWLPGLKLEGKLRKEVARDCNEGLLLVRLHYLGDFYSRSYVRLWRTLLEEHPNLHCFGFTAHLPGSRIGADIVGVRRRFGSRFSIRHSGMTGPWGSFTIDFPTEKKRLGDAVVCPEQRDAMEGGSKEKHCGNCALCWQSDVPIVFVEH